MSSAFFTEEAVERPAQALVREAIQNSLGAHDGSSQVRVRFNLGVMFSQEVASFWFASAWPHFATVGSGVRPGSNRPVEGCAVVVEDFGTVGLEGDENEWRPHHVARDNHFFNFVRAEGFSNKVGDQGGRWGIGKTVFPRSSRINSLYAYTVRRDDNRRLLIGRTILKHRSLGDVAYTPDGHYGHKPDRLVLPVEESPVLDRFCGDFSVSRRGEPGLSVVVPYADDNITTASVTDSVVREYFWPILRGRLVVEIGSQTLAAANLRDEVQRIGGDLATDMLPVVDFAAWAQSQQPNQHHVLNAHPPDYAPRWGSELIPETSASELRRRFRRGDPMAIWVPTFVCRQNGIAEPTQFSVYLQRDANGKGTVPTFVRSDILVPEARARRVRNHSVHVIVAIEDLPLATLLGDAEPPAHTRWSIDTDRFKAGNYKFGGALLDFVRNAPARLAEYLSAEDQQSDALSLADFFPTQADDEDAPARRKKRAGRDAPEDNDPPKPRLRAYEIDLIEGGFVIRRGSPEVPRPHRIDVRVAYDRSRGSPLGKYTAADFDLKGLRRQLPGAREVTCHDNRLIFDVLDDAFRVQVTGFDPQRDLYVRANAINVSGVIVEEELDDQAA